jgi:hypothetical protein
MISQDLSITGFYNYAFVALSFVTRVFESFQALDLTGRVIVANAAAPGSGEKGEEDDGEKPLSV